MTKKMGNYKDMTSKAGKTTKTSKKPSQAMAIAEAAKMARYKK